MDAVTVTTAARRADAGTVRLSDRDASGLLLCGDMYAAPYDLLSPWRALLLIPARIRHGRPLRLLLRTASAVLLALLVVHIGPGAPTVAALITGIVTWLILTARGDLAPPPDR